MILNKWRIIKKKSKIQLPQKDERESDESTFHEQ
jgi:hypothetical protein